MDHPHPTPEDTPTESPLQGDAHPIESDHQIWLTIEGEGPFTLHELILANSEPGVTPLAALTAAMIRTLEIGETYEAFGDAPITRIPAPQKP